MFGGKDFDSMIYCVLEDFLMMVFLIVVSFLGLRLVLGLLILVVMLLGLVMVRLVFIVVVMGIIWCGMLLWLRLRVRWFLVLVGIMV